MRYFHYYYTHIIIVCSFIHWRASVAQFDCADAEEIRVRLLLSVWLLCVKLIQLPVLEGQRRWWRQQRCNRNLFCSVTNSKFLTNIMIKRRVLFSPSFVLAPSLLPHTFKRSILSKRAYVCGVANAISIKMEQKNKNNRKIKKKYFQ